MKSRDYLPGVKKRLLKLKAKKFGGSIGIYVIIIVVSISGNFYLKSKDPLKNTLFYQPEDKMSKMTVQSNAISENVDELKKERDILLLKVKEQEEAMKSINKPVVETMMEEKPILNKKIKAIAHNLGGVMTGHSTYLYNKCLENDLNPLMVAAIIKHESGNGTSRAIRIQNNIAGFMGNRGLMTFYNINNSIDFMASLLKKHYIDQGLNTLEKIQPKYCPIGATNDPKGLNKHWLPMVTEYYNTLVAESV